SRNSALSRLNPGRGVALAKPEKDQAHHKDRDGGDDQKNDVIFLRNIQWFLPKIATRQSAMGSRIETTIPNGAISFISVTKGNFGRCGSKKDRPFRHREDLPDLAYGAAST